VVAPVVVAKTSRAALVSLPSRLPEMVMSPSLATFSMSSPLVSSKSRKFGVVMSHLTDSEKRGQKSMAAGRGKSFRPASRGDRQLADHLLVEGLSKEQAFALASTLHSAQNGLIERQRQYR